MEAHQHACAAAQGPAAPERPRKDDARELGSGAGIEWGQGVVVGEDSAARAAIEEADKAFNTLRAQLALCGFELHVVTDAAGGPMYLVQRWCQSRTLASIEDVRAFARQIGGVA